MSDNATVTSTRLVPWEKDELRGVEIKYSDEHRTAYCVGTRAEAEIVKLRADAGYALKARAP